jgi:hypothetical protein
MSVVFALALVGMLWVDPSSLVCLPVLVSSGGRKAVRLARTVGALPPPLQHCAHTPQLSGF